MMLGGCGDAAASARLAAAACVLILGAILVFLLLRSAPFFATEGATGLLLDEGW